MIKDKLNATKQARDAYIDDSSDLSRRGSRKLG